MTQLCGCNPPCRPDGAPARLSPRVVWSDVINPPTFAKDELVHHPYDGELYGHVVSQDCGSVVVRWDNGDVDSQGAVRLDACREESDYSGCDYFRGVGICTNGCWEEPHCRTGEPAEGWPATRPRA